ncbi:MAG: alpha/beta fold hydrolase [Alphaproteobacteria bacterium]
MTPPTRNTGLRRRRALCLAAAALCLTGGTVAAQAGERQIAAAGPVGALHGTLAGVAATGTAQPVMIVIPGSGPTDRNGNSPLGIAASTYAMLAEALADAGIATIRIDKRGMFESAAPGVDPNAVTIADYVDDIGAWVTAARAATGAGCVWLAGHSEGGLVALAAAQRLDDLCGLVLIAAPGRRLGDVMRAQLRANPANAVLLDDALGAIDSLEAGTPADVAAIHPALQQLFAPAVQGFLISLYSYDPAALLAAYDGPVLVVQGDSRPGGDGGGRRAPGRRPPRPRRHRHRRHEPRAEAGPGRRPRRQPGHLCRPCPAAGAGGRPGDRGIRAGLAGAAHAAACGRLPARSAAATIRTATSPRGRPVSAPSPHRRPSMTPLRLSAC